MRTRVLGIGLLSLFACSSACSSSGNGGFGSVDGGGSSHASSTKHDGGKKADGATEHHSSASDSGGDVGQSSGTPDTGIDTGHPTHDAHHDVGSSGHDAGNPDVGASDASKPDTGVDSGVDCMGSTVPQYVTSNLTLVKACSPYYAALPVLVGDATNNPVLTIEPGVTVTFASNAYLSIGMGQSGAAPGGISATGSVAEPVVFTSHSTLPSAGSWGGIYFNPMANPASTIASAVVEYAGQPFGSLLNSPRDLGSIYVDAGTATPATSSKTLHIQLENLTVSHNGGSGIVFFGPFAGFAPSSGAITIPDWATGGYPIIIDPNSAATLSSVLTTGTGHQGAIGLIQEEQNVGGSAQVTLIHDQTFPPMPIPYLVDTFAYTNITGAGNCGLFIDGTGATTVTLTIEGPNTIEVETPPAGGTCGIYVSSNKPGGRIVANGTASGEIVFTSAKTTPTLTDWAGVYVTADGPTTLFGATAFSYSTFSYASNGKPMSTELFFDGSPTCGMTIGAGTPGPGVTNCTFVHYGGCGVEGLDLTNISAAYGSGTAGADGNVYMPTSPNMLGVCVQGTCPF